LIRHDLVDDRERADLLAIAEGPPLPASQLVVGAVLANAATRPNRHAVTDVAGALTYGELVARSASVAAGLVRLGVVPGDIVGVCLPRDRFLPAALLGVWRAGAAYLPMDPDHPADRLAWLAEDVGARTVLTADTVLDDGPAALPMVGPDDLAYVLFTSGSTGRPKAVAVTHANLAAGIAGVLAEPGLGRSDVMSAVAPLTFDVSAEEIWAPLTAGARCVMVERACATDGFALAERIAGSGVTVLDVTPTTLRMLLATGWTGDRELKVLTGGEVLDPAVAHQVLAMVGGLWNCYGPTETTISSTTHRVSTADSGAIPIGRPMPGERCYVMDPLGRLVPRGVVGELWLGGAGVARGYHGRPDLTEHAFVSDPVVSGGRCYRTGDLVRWRADGALEFVGRRDEQVKVRGYRIELGEVTAALRTVDGVADAAVAAAGTAGDTHLVGYLTPAHLATDVVEKRLRTVLPDHLVPRRWVLLDVLPTLANGKLDRAGLPAPPRESARDRRPPVGDAELLVADVWAEVLDRPQVWADDDFFALGGHSFAATRVVGRLRDALGLAVPVLMLFDNPVLADFAAALERSLLDDLAAQPQGTRA